MVQFSLSDALNTLYDYKNDVITPKQLEEIANTWGVKGIDYTADKEEVLKEFDFIFGIERAVG